MKLKKRGGVTYRPEERQSAVEAFGKSGLTQSEFCKVWGITPNTMLSWRKRYREGGGKGLLDSARGRKKGSVCEIAGGVKEAIWETKGRFPDFGLKKIRDFLRRFEGLKVSVHSVRRELRSQGVGPVKVVRPKRKRSEECRRFERSRAGELWQSDITSFVLTRHSQRVYLTVFLDDFSRYIVSFGLELHQRQELVSEALLEGIARFGKPEEVLTDQGRQYVSWRGKSAFRALLDREGIAHVVSRTHHPETLGKCERLWETIGIEFWERLKPQDLADARERLAHWISHYNHFRPHQGIGGLVPADRFFGAEKAIREHLESAMEKNELAIALGEKPRKPLFLIGQIGGKEISLHGESGRVVIQTSDGLRQEMGMEELGIDRKEKRDGDAGTGPDSTGTGKEIERDEASAAGDCGAGTLGERERGGKISSPPLDGSDAGILAREETQGGSGGRDGDDTSSGVADESASSFRNGGGPFETAPRATEQGDRDGAKRGSQDPEKENRGARKEIEDRGRLDRALAGDAAESGSEVVTSRGEKKDEGSQGESAKWRGFGYGRESGEVNEAGSQDSSE